MAEAEAPSFPRRYARTRRFRLGRPRSATVAPDGARVLFLRALGGDDPTTALWCLEDGEERLLADPRDLDGPAPDTSADGASGGDTPGGERSLGGAPSAERDLRERRREIAEGITAYATDRNLQRASFTLSGRLYVLDVASGETTAVTTGAPAFDPRPSPDGRRLAYVAGSGLWAGEPGGAARLVEGGENVRWGVPEFIAAEEMGRHRGYWWGPDSRRIAACRVDESGVQLWHLADPARPERPARPHRYPAAGTANADVSLAVVSLAGAATVDIDWDRGEFPYLARVAWPESAPLTLLVQSRDQRRWRVLVADPDSGTTETLREDHDDAWLDLVPGVPAWLGDGLVMVLYTERGPGGTRQLVVDGEAVTPPGLQVAGVVEAGGGSVWFSASREPTEQHLYRWEAETGQLDRLTSERGVHSGAVGGGTVVVFSEALGRAPSFHVAPTGAGLASHAEEPAVEPDVELLTLGQRGLKAALLLPREDSGPLPVLLDPYGGPHAQRVVASRDAYLEAQWLADQGFAVLVVDGRGTPGRGPDWERAVRGDLAGPVLDDQIAALQAVAADRARLDLDRVAIRGWSFGGFLAALGVLRRPDVFRAGIAGAPVVDWRLYDTHYTERYLGHPDETPEAYRRSSLVDEQGRLLGAADPPAGRDPELLIIHGLADDNVVAAHSLRLSGALLAAGRSHRFLPLSGVTHMTPQEVVAENLLRLQAAFLRDALAG